ncbi:MAG: DUF411 domain-containing protein [Nitrososphaerota archaeon]|nr:CopG family transcriptional regulator [Candidatus Calditenuaceae archaeon]MDW8073367.1 DUF411 domain-containing protein [Nitrososphaerota archaeon]
MRKKGQKGRIHKMLGPFIAAISTTLVIIAAILLSQALDGTRQTASTSPANIEITVYRTSACSCCAEYEEYLRSKRVVVKTIILDPAGLSDLRRRIGIPSALLSCHTSIVEDYFVEGHVPLEVISRLLAERPDVDGIALPGMPQGVPGMGGTRKGPLQVFALSGDSISVFMEL